MPIKVYKPEIIVPEMPVLTELLHFERGHFDVEVRLVRSILDFKDVGQMEDGYVSDFNGYVSERKVEASFHATARDELKVKVMADKDGMRKIPELKEMVTVNGQQYRVEEVTIDNKPDILYGYDGRAREVWPHERGFGTFKT